MLADARAPAVLAGAPPPPMRADAAPATVRALGLVSAVLTLLPWLCRPGLLRPRRRPSPRNPPRTSKCFSCPPALPALALLLAVLAPPPPVAPSAAVRGSACALAARLRPAAARWRLALLGGARPRRSEVHDGDRRAARRHALGVRRHEGQARGQWVRWDTGR